MVLARRILPFAGTLFLFTLYSGLLLRPSEWQTWVGIIAVFTVVSILFLLKWQWKTLDFWSALFPIAALLIGGTGMLFFLDSALSQWLFSALLAVLYGAYTESVFTYHYQPQKYTALSLPTLSLYLMLFASFALFSFGYALNLIGEIKLWVITLTALVFSTIMMLHQLRGYKIWNEQHIGVVLFVALLIGELAWVLQFWPTAFYINGFVIALVLYAITSLVTMKLRDTLTKRSIINYTTISILAAVAILSTTQWT